MMFKPTIVLRCPALSHTILPCLTQAHTIFNAPSYTPPGTPPSGTPPPGTIIFLTVAKECVHNHFNVLILDLPKHLLSILNPLSKFRREPSEQLHSLIISLANYHLLNPFFNL